MTNRLAPTVQALGLELLGLQFVPQARGTTLRIYLDVPAAEQGQRAVTITDCERVSREVSALLDVDDPIAGRYTLEVSSPGVDRPLFQLAHYQQCLGAEVRLRLHLAVSGRRQYRGKIHHVDLDQRQVTIQSAEGQLSCLSLDQIDQARLVPDWTAFGEMAPRRKGAPTKTAKAKSKKSSINRAATPPRAE